MAYLKSNVRGINFQSMLTDLQLPVAALTRHVTANLKQLSLRRPTGKTQIVKN